MKKLLFLFIIQVSLFAVVRAQPGRDETLAASYLQNGEFDKAAELYQSLWEKSNYDLKFYVPLYKCLLTLKKYDDLEKVVKREIKKNNDTPQYIIDLGYMYSQIPEPGKAKDQFEKALKEVKPNEISVRNLASAYENYKLYDYVIAVYEKGGKISRTENYFGMELAGAYLAKGDIPGAVKYFILNLETNPQNEQIVKNTVQTSRDELKLLNELETQLYSKVQKNPSNEDYIDLLTWIYVQNKDFEGALAQMKALDKRKNENGFRVINIARMAQTEGDYDNAIGGFEYVVNKGKDNSMYFQARTELLNCRKEKISKNINYTQEDLVGLKNSYLAFINDNERGFRTAQSMKELADLEGFYLHDLTGAIELCNEIIKMPGITVQLKNQSKLSLGDFYLISGDIWESTLLYSQVDKDEKDSPLGEEARFRNAKLAYYKGDFEWAQTQLEVLKSSTSELISNDAINLSVFIIDNLGLDTVATPMQMFARAELLQFQNKDDDAVTTMDSIMKLFPGHALADDIEYTKAVIYVKHKDFEKATPLLEDILKNYKTDLKGDDATFLLGEISEQHLHSKEKAMEYYKSIITDYSNSLLVIEARKRYRLLRGDKINE
ncbi:MAG: Tetratricopeptide 2 repeat-containing protein [Bacteroidota bacterium]|nr:Tetratricopeptide 2 repeat-containing protein [Bacteroidota bacterium]